jgi:hypothetical protein
MIDPAVPYLTTANSSTCTVPAGPLTTWNPLPIVMNCRLGVLQGSDAVVQQRVATSILLAHEGPRGQQLTQRIVTRVGASVAGARLE